MKPSTLGAMMATIVFATSPKQLLGRFQGGGWKLLVRPQVIYAPTA